MAAYGSRSATCETVKLSVVFEEGDGEGRVEAAMVGGWWWGGGHPKEMHRQSTCGGRQVVIQAGMTSTKRREKHRSSCEELLPFTDLVPLCTIFWIMETFFSKRKVAGLILPELVSLCCCCCWQQGRRRLCQWLCLLCVCVIQHTERMTI